MGTRTLAVALMLLGACRTTIMHVPATDIAVQSALPRTLLMTEGCTAVDIGEGMVLTAAHCVDELARGDETSVGMIVYQSPVADFAVLFDTARLGNPRAHMRAPRPYEHVYAVGYPVQLVDDKQALTVTDGLVAGPIDAEGQWRITAPIFYGNSGGGLWGQDGALVGLTVSGILGMPAMNYIVSAADISLWVPRK